MKEVEESLKDIDHEEFLEQLLAIVEKQVVCSDVGNVCDIRITSFGQCCINCGLLPHFWEDVDQYDTPVEDLEDES